MSERARRSAESNRNSYSFLTSNPAAANGEVVFLKRWHITLSGVLDRAPKFTAKDRKAIIHINVDAHSTGPQQPKDVCSAFPLLF